jgi:hypothetical protein
MNANPLALFWEGFTIDPIISPMLNPCSFGCNLPMTTYLAAVAVTSTRLPSMTPVSDAFASATCFTTVFGWKSLFVEFAASRAGPSLSRFAGYPDVSI